MAAIGIRSKLLPSIVFLGIFYWLVGLLLFLFKSRPAAGTGAEVHSFYAWLFAELNEQREIIVQSIAAGGRSTVTAVLIGTLFSFAALQLYLTFIRQNRARKNHWRGLSTSLGAMPHSSCQSVKPASVHDKRIEPRFLPLLNEIFGYLFSTGELSSGPGHGCSLYEHSMNVFLKSLEQQEFDPVLPILAAAHDIGKAAKHQDTRLAAYRHSQLSAGCIAMLPSWWTLSESERATISLALTYYHSPAKLPRSTPSLCDDEMVRLRLLIGALRQLDSTETAEEKATLVAGVEVNKSYTELFWNCLEDAPFQTPSIAKGVKAIGWRKNGSLYILATGVARRVLDELGDEMVAALRQAPFSRTDTLNVMVDKLRDELKAASIITLTVDGVESSSGLWNIKSGDHTFKNVFIIDERLAPFELPALTRYTIGVISPAQVSPEDGQQTEAIPIEISENGKAQASLDDIISHAHAIAKSSSQIPDECNSSKEPVAAQPMDLSFIGLMVPKKRE